MNKKISLALGMLFVAMTAMAGPVKYVVTGKNLKAYEGVKFRITAVSITKSATLDSAVVRDGVLSFKGTVESPIVCSLSSADSKRPATAVIVLGDDSELTVSAENDALTVKGGKRQSLFDTYATEKAKIGIPSQADQRKLLEEYDDPTTTDTRKKQLEGIFTDIQNKTKQFDRRFILAHCDNVVGAYFFVLNYANFTSEDIKALESKMTPEFSTYELAAVPLATIKAGEKRRPGNMYTDFSQPDKDGKMHKLSEFVKPGRYVLVDFWASWCGPCRAEMPNVRALYEKYHERGFDVVGVSLDSKRESWLKAVEQMKLPWIQLSDLKACDCEAARLYGVQAIPCTILIGPDGKIVGADLCGEELGVKLAQVFGE